MEEGHVRPVRRPRPVGRDPAGRRPRAGADGVPRRVVLGPRGHLRRRRRPRAADVPGQAALASTARRVARGSDFGPDGELKDKARNATSSTSTAAAPRRWSPALRDTTYDVRSVESKPYRRSPYAPFRTTTLQQEASRKLGMSASVTMSVAQRLYENGFITYMRTDSTTLSERRGRRGPVAGARAVRRRVPPRRAAGLRQQGQERAGGARGDPAGRRLVPHARRRPG